MKRTVGRKLMSKLCHKGGPESSGSALTTTPFRWRSCASALVSANAGTSVLNLVVGFDFAYDCGHLNVPWIDVPFEVIAATWPADTWLRKNGLYGTRTRAGSCIAREPAQMLIANNATASAIHRQPGRKRGGVAPVPEGGGVDPRPSAA